MLLLPMLMLGPAVPATLPYLDTSLTPDQRAKDLVQRLTLEQQVQLHLIPPFHARSRRHRPPAQCCSPITVRCAVKMGPWGCQHAYSGDVS